MKIIILGAGIAGLTLALACKKAGMEVKIYEKTRKLRNIGGGVLLWPNGIRFMEWLGLSECVRPYHLPISRCNIVSLEGQTIFSEEYAAFYSRLGGEIIPVDRSMLQQTLTAALPPQALQLGKECREIQSSADSAQVLFSDGSHDAADLIVGADGIHSFVRNTLNQAQLDYTGYCWWGGMIDQKDVPDLPIDEVFVAIGIGKMCIVWPTQGGRFMWYLPVKMDENNFDRSEDGLAQLQRICSGWHPLVQQIIQAPGSTQRFHLPIHSLQPQSAWSKNRVTLVGDAAHALGPILGLGASLAIEDVFVLVNCLKQNNETIAAKLARYESFRHARCRRFYELETQSAATMVNDDIETLREFQLQIPHLDLATLYQDLIPLIDENACVQLATSLMQDSMVAA